VTDRAETVDPYATHARLLGRFEAALTAHQQTWQAAWPERLRASCAYALGTGGKRVRPVVCLMAAEACGADADIAVPFALAVELIHTYSLVHDDLPSMDDDDFRRGQPTCHKKFGEAQAILTGDALLTEAFAVLGAAGASATQVALLATAAGGGGMVGGQVLDIDEAPVRDTDALEHLHRLKTGALLRAAVLGGGLAAGADTDAQAALSRYGAALGLLFQITDDLLDATQDADAGNRSYLNYTDAETLRVRALAVAADAGEAARRLGPAGEALALFAEAILNRKS
jgi:geranylgeranyl diphosphate synthase type II